MTDITQKPIMGPVQNLYWAPWYSSVTGGMRHRRGKQRSRHRAVRCRSM